MVKGERMAPKIRKKKEREKEVELKKEDKKE